MTRERTWTFTDPDGTVILTETEILAGYYAYWCQQMAAVGKADQISEAACIDDWVLTHWAHPTDQHLFR